MPIFKFIQFMFRVKSVYIFFICFKSNRCIDLDEIDQSCNSSKKARTYREDTYTGEFDTNLENFIKNFDFGYLHTKSLTGGSKSFNSSDTDQSDSQVDTSVSYGIFKCFIETDKKKFISQKNFKNCNNNCYVNVMIQCLFTQKQIKTGVSQYEKFEKFKTIFQELQNADLPSLTISNELEILKNESYLKKDEGGDPDEFMLKNIHNNFSKKFCQYENDFMTNPFYTQITTTKNAYQANMEFYINKNFTEYLFEENSKTLSINPNLITKENFKTENLKTIIIKIIRDDQQNDEKNIKELKIYDEFKINYQKAGKNNEKSFHLNAIIIYNEFIKHYYCFCKREDHWFLLDRTGIKAYCLTTDGVKLMLTLANEQAYMLFYADS
ncbi:hypothetical protein GVAV_002022 [Gurleya vavrai]